MEVKHKKAEGVLAQMIANMDEEHLSKTRKYMMTDIVRFSVNNWEPTCPETCNNVPVLDNVFINLPDSDQFAFTDDDFCKQQKICVYNEMCDMSVTSNVVAPREWVEKYWPEIINSEFDYTNKDDIPIFWYDDDNVWPDYHEDNFGCSWPEYYEVIEKQAQARIDAYNECVKNCTNMLTEEMEASMHL